MPNIGFIDNRPEEEKISLVELMVAQEYHLESDDEDPITTYFANTSIFSPQKKRKIDYTGMV